MKRGLKTGMTNNPAGKPKGTKNKLSAKVKEMFENFLEENYDSFMIDYKSIKDPAVKCKIYLDAAKFIIPKPKDSEEEEEKDRMYKEIIDRIWPVPKTE